MEAVEAGTLAGAGAKLPRMNRLFYIMLILAGLMFVLSDLIQFRNESGEWIFLTRSNISNILNQVSINAVIAFGMTLVILTRGIDLSAGSVVAAGGVFLSILFVDAKLPLWLCYCLTLAAGGLAGAVNGALVAFLRLPPFIATLGSMILYRGVAFLLVDGRAKFISGSQFKIAGNGFVWGVAPVAVIVMLGFFLVFHFLATATTFGKRAYFLGGNEAAAALVGIDTKVMRLVIFAGMGFMSAAGGILLASRLGSGSPNIGSGYEMDAIAAVVVGGTSFLGGKGSVIGTLLGAIVIGIIANGMNLMGISPYFQYLAKGVIILTAVILSSEADASRRR